MPLESWARPYFEPGGGDAQVLYAVFGAFQDVGPLSASRYRSHGPPAGVELIHYAAPKHQGVLDHFRGGWSWNQVVTQSTALADAVMRTTECLVLKGVVPDPETLDYFRDVIGLIAYLADRGGVGVYDAQILEWWSADEWREDVFGPGTLRPTQHVSILYSDDEQERGRWFHTRGMRKFGRPDLSVTGVPESMDEAVVELIRRFIHLQALGGRVSEGEPIRMAALPAGLTCRHAGDADDLDFNNSHIEIAWPRDA